jgi:A/G-specific adenine glycosylase
VLARYFAIEGFPGERQVEQKLWELADACTPAEGVAQYTQAIMDLGATLCVRSRPLCDLCPLSASCIARAEHKQAMLPTPRPKKVRPERTAFVVLAFHDGAALLERRPPAGIWGGLWTFPQFDELDAAQRWIEEQTATAAAAERLAPYCHSFTHFDLTLHPIVVRADRAVRLADAARYCWYDSRRPAKIGLAKPVVELLQRLEVA